MDTGPGEDEHVEPSDPGNPPFPSVLSPRSLQIKLRISLPNLPSTTISSPSSSHYTISDSSDSHNEFQISDMPQVVVIYDSLPTQLKSYFLLHLLKKSPMQTLQFVLSYVLPIMKRDFLSLLPREIGFRMLSYLDPTTLGRCRLISKSWYTILNSEMSEKFLWHPLLEMKGWLPSQMSSIFCVDEDISKDSKNYYRNLYKSHYVMEQNWFNERYKCISFPGHSFNVVTCLQFDSRRIISGSDDQTINIYDITNGCLLKRLRGHDGGVWALQYWDNVLVSGSTDRTVRVWDMEKGDCTHIFEGHTSTVRCLIIITPSYCHVEKKIIPEAPVIVTGSRDSTLRVWGLPLSRDLVQGEAAVFGRPDSSNPYFLKLLQGHTNSVRAISGKCNVLISGSYDCTVRYWNLTTGDCVYVFRGHREKVYSVDYCHQIQRAASGSMDSTVRVWCTRTGMCLFVLEGHTSLVGLLEFSPKFLISAAADATVRIWSAETGKCLANLKGHTAAITCFHHDEKLNRIVSGSEGGIKVWELCSETSHGKISYGTLIGDLVVCVQGVWRVKMNERYLVTAVQRDEGKTWFDVLDFGYKPTHPDQGSSNQIEEIPT